MPGKGSRSPVGASGMGAIAYPRPCPVRATTAVFHIMKWSYPQDIHSPGTLLAGTLRSASSPALPVLGAVLTHCNILLNQWGIIGVSLINI